MSGKKKPAGALVAAAQTLEQQLHDFDDQVEAFKQLTINSQKGLERGKQLLESLAAAEARAGEHVQALVAAVAATAKEQGARVEAVRAKAEHLAARATEYEALVTQFGTLGEGASSLNARLKGEPVSVELDGEIGALVQRAEALVAQARTQHFDDVAHLADGLRQQVSALRSKLQQVQGRG